MRVFHVILLGMIIALIAGCASMKTAGTQAERHDVLYFCDCGPQCKCKTVSTKPGKCACGAPLRWGHVIKMEGNVAVVCQCKKGCTCTGLDPKDPSKCACGTPIRRIDLTGTGIYFCNCGGSCFCNTVSDKPGKCKCGMDLKKVDK